MGWGHDVIVYGFMLYGYMPLSFIVTDISLFVSIQMG